MADVSLDEYIKTDFRSKERRGNIHQNKHPQLASANKPANQRSRPLIMKNPARRSDQKLPVKQRINIDNRSVPNRSQQSYLPKRNKILSRKLELNQFDARLKLSTKSFKDAREKIGSNVIDARHKIQKSQAKKFEQDARKKISLKRGLNNNGNQPKITVTGLGKQHSFRESTSGMTTASGANIIRTVNNRDHQSRLASTSDVTVSLKRTLTNDYIPSDSGGRLLGNSSNNPLGMSGMQGSYTVHNDKLQIMKNVSSKTDDRSNIATYEPLRGPVIQLKNDHYREKPVLPKSMDYDYDNSPEYSHVPSSIRHLPSSSSPPSSSSWLSHPSSHPHTPTSVARKDKYEMSSSTNKPLSLDRGNALKLPRPSRDLIVGMAPSAAKRIKPAGNVDSHSQFPSSDVLSNSSSVSGYRVLVTNLHPIVTQDDIIELFGAVGALKKAHLLKPGCAEVVYISYNDAVAAVNKYHNRELDGQPMIVKQTTTMTIVSSSLHSSSSSSNIPKSLGEPLKFRKDVSNSSTGSKADGSSSRGGTVSQASSSSTSSSVVDVNLIHKALFSHKNTGSTSASSGTSSRPVTFTVKI